MIFPLVGVAQQEDPEPPLGCERAADRRNLVGHSLAGCGRGTQRLIAALAEQDVHTIGRKTERARQPALPGSGGLLKERLVLLVAGQADHHEARSPRPGGSSARGMAAVAARAAARIGAVSQRNSGWTYVRRVTPPVSLGRLGVRLSYLAIDGDSMSCEYEPIAVDTEFRSTPLRTCKSIEYRSCGHRL